MYLTQEAINARAAEAGFTVGDYVHHFLRTYRAAGRIKSFSLIDDVLTVSWMDGATSCPLSEVRLSSGHQRRAQFGPGYDFFTSPALIAEALRQGQVSEDLRFDYTGAWVKGYGTEQAEVWATSQPDPYDEATAFMRVSDAPAFYAPNPELSSAEVAPTPAPQAPEADSDYKLQVLVSGQPITERAIEVQMKVNARKAKAYFREMKQRYGDKPTMLHLALFSGATDLLAMVRELRKAGALASS